MPRKLGISSYEYGNARVRAMKSRLLDRRDLEALAEAGSLQGLIGALAKTDYREAIEVALTRASGLDCVTDALRRSLLDTLGRIRDFYGGRAGNLVAAWLRIYDVHNLKTILRGLSKQASSDEIAAALLPVSELTPSMLARLISVPEPRAAIDLLVTAQMPIAQPLINLRAESPGAGVFEMELALDKWYFQEACRYLQGTLRSTLLHAALAQEADLTNLLTALRFAHAPAERREIRQRLSGEGLDHLFVESGELPVELLVQVSEQDSLESAVRVLARTPYAPPLRAGLRAYSRSGRLSDLESQLRRFRLDWMAKLFIRDPLGIGVPLGYFALKTSETINIRWVAYGLHLGLEANTIKTGLEFVT
jgi:V/A-type H+-transporting ATPase subunit C